MGHVFLFIFEQNLITNHLLYQDPMEKQRLINKVWVVALMRKRGGVRLSYNLIVSDPKLGTFCLSP